MVCFYINYCALMCKILPSICLQRNKTYWFTSGTYSVKTLSLAQTLCNRYLKTQINSVIIHRVWCEIWVSESFVACWSVCYKQQAVIALSANTVVPRNSTSRNSTVELRQPAHARCHLLFVSSYWSALVFARVVCANFQFCIFHTLHH
jgi:hypothetical protein